MARLEAMSSVSALLVRSSSEIKISILIMKDL